MHARLAPNTLALGKAGDRSLGLHKQRLVQGKPGPELLLEFLVGMRIVIDDYDLCNLEELIAMVLERADIGRLVSGDSDSDSSSAATRLQHSQEVSSPTYNNANAERIGFFTAAASANIDNIDQIMQGHGS